MSKANRVTRLSGVLLAILLAASGCNSVSGDGKETTAANSTDHIQSTGDMMGGTADVPNDNDNQGNSNSSTGGNGSSGVQDVSGREEDYTANTALENVGDKYRLTDISDAVNIDIAEATIAVNGTEVSVADETEPISGVMIRQTDFGGIVVTVTAGGVYRFSGESTQVQIAVDAGDEKVWLVLDGVKLSYPQGPVLYVLQADKTVLNLAEGSDNYISDIAADAADEKADAAIYAKDDLIINGMGSLTVHGNVDKGIHCKDDLKLRGGKLTVATTVGDAVQGNDSVEISGGEILIDSAKDGIATNNTEEAEKGYIEITAGSITVIAAGDGIQSKNTVLIQDGLLKITSGGGWENGPSHSSDFMGGGFWWGGNSQGAGSNDDTETSQKGIKAENQITVQGGMLYIDSADDAIHCNQTIQIEGGYMELSTGDDGIHADDSLTLTGTSAVRVLHSYEGLEAATVTVAGGCHHINASDDGLNASAKATTGANTPGGGFGGRGGMGGFMGSSQDALLEITGGYLYVNAGGDGLDSNGELKISGGITLVCGPTDSANGALDSGEGSTIEVTGGILLALGSIGMMETPAANYAATTQLNAAAGTQIVITDDTGAVLLVFTTPKQAAGLVCSVNGMSEGYHIYTGGQYTGEVNEDGYGTGGTYSGGTEVAQSTGGGGFGGWGNGGGFGGGPGGGFGGGGRR